MTCVPTFALVCAVVVSLVAAITDGRFGLIPNLVTLPGIVLAPVAYGAVGGLPALLFSLLGVALCGAAPYLLFRAGAMGGGDVKLFAALGALTGCDPLVGLRIQFLALVAAMLGVVCTHARRGRLPTTLYAALGRTALAFRGRQPRPTLEDRDAVRVRLGGSILAATLFHAAALLSADWPS